MLTLAPPVEAVLRVALSADGGRVCVVGNSRVVFWAEGPDWDWRDAPEPGGGRLTAGGHARELVLHSTLPLAAVLNLRSTAASAPHVVASDLAAGTAVALALHARPGDPWVEPRLAFSADGRELIGVSDAGLARWRVGDWSQSLAPFPAGVRPACRCFHLAPTGRVAVLDASTWGDPPFEVRFLAHPDDAGIRAATSHGGPDGAFSADGRRFAVRDLYGPKLRAWDADTGAALAVVRPRGRVTVPALTPDGRTTLIGVDNVVIGLDTDTGREKWVLDWNAGRVLAVTVSGNGLTAAAGTAAGKVVLWDLDI